MNQYKYDAFISYSRRNARSKKLVPKIQRWIEAYTIPKIYRPSLVTDKGRRPRVSRDHTDLPLSDDVLNLLRTKVTESRHLILACSPEAAESQWVREELQTYVDNRGAAPGGELITLLVDGDPEKVIPAAAKRSKSGPNYGDFTPRRSDEGFLSYRERLHNEVLRCLGQMFAIQYDELKKRDTARRRNRNIAAFSTLSVVLAIVTWLSLVAFAQWRRAEASQLAERAAKIEALHQLAQTKIESASSRLQLGQALDAARNAKEAIAIEDVVPARYSLWESLRQIPAEQVAYIVERTEQKGYFSDPCPLADGSFLVGDSNTVYRCRSILPAAGTNQLANPRLPAGPMESRIVAQWPQRVGHIRAWAYDRAAQRVYAGGRRPGIEAWDLTSPQAIALPAVSLQVVSLALDEKGRRLLLGGEDGGMSCVTLSSNGWPGGLEWTEPLAETNAAGSREVYLALPPGGRVIFAAVTGGSPGSRVVAYDLENRKVVWSRAMPNLGRIAVSPDGQYVAWHLLTGLVEIAAADSGRLWTWLQPADGASLGYANLAFSPDSHYLALARLDASHGHSFTEWHVPLGERSMIYESTASLSYVQYVSANRLLVAGAVGHGFFLDRSPLVNVVSNGLRAREILVVTNSTWVVGNADRATTGELVRNRGLLSFDLREGASREVGLWQLTADGQCRRYPHSLPAGATCIAFSDDGSLVVGTKAGQVKVLEAGTGRSLGDYAFGQDVGLLQSGMGGIVVAAGDQFGGKMEMLRLVDGRIGPTVPLEDEHAGAVNAVCLLPRQQQVVVAYGNKLDSGDAELVFFDWAGNQPLKRVAIPSAAKVRRLVALQQDRQVLAACGDGALRAFDVVGTRLVRELRLSHYPLTAVALDPSSPSLALVGDANGGLYACDLGAMSLLYRFQPWSSAITALAPLGHDEWLLGTETGLFRLSGLGNRARLEGQWTVVRTESIEELYQQAARLEQQGERLAAARLYHRLWELDSQSATLFHERRLTATNRQSASGLEQMVKQVLTPDQPTAAQEKARTAKEPDVVLAAMATERAMASQGQWRQTHDLKFLGKAVAECLDALHFSKESGPAYLVLAQCIFEDNDPENAALCGEVAWPYIPAEASPSWGCFWLGGAALLGKDLSEPRTYLRAVLQKTAYRLPLSKRYLFALPSGISRGCLPETSLELFLSGCDVLSQGDAAGAKLLFQRGKDRQGPSVTRINEIGLLRADGKKGLPSGHPEYQVQYQALFRYLAGLQAAQSGDYGLAFDHLRQLSPAWGNEEYMRGRLLARSLRELLESFGVSLADLPSVQCEVPAASATNGPGLWPQLWSELARSQADAASIRLQAREHGNRKTEQGIADFYLGLAAFSHRDYVLAEQCLQAVAGLAIEDLPESTMARAMLEDLGLMRQVQGRSDDRAMLNRVLLQACRGGRFSVVQAMIRLGADVNSRGEGGVTPGLLATSRGRLDLARLLTAHRADLEAVADDGCTSAITLGADRWGWLPDTFHDSHRADASEGKPRATSSGLSVSASSQQLANGSIAHWLGMHSEANRCFERALEALRLVSPPRPLQAVDCAVRLCNVAIESGQNAAAMNHAAYAVSVLRMVKPGSLQLAQCLSSLSWTKFLAGNGASAATHAAEAVALATNDPACQINYGHTLLFNGKTNEAVLLYARFLGEFGPERSDKTDQLLEDFVRWRDSDGPALVLDFAETKLGLDQSQLSSTRLNGRLGLGFETVANGWRITQVASWGSAARSGQLKVGDVVVSACDHHGRKVSTENLALNSTARLMLGPAGSHARLWITRTTPDAERASFEIRLLRTVD